MEWAILFQHHGQRVTIIPDKKKSKGRHKKSVQATACVNEHVNEVRPSIVTEVKATKNVHGDENDTVTDFLCSIMSCLYSDYIKGLGVVFKLTPTVMPALRLCCLNISGPCLLIYTTGH